MIINIFSFESRDHLAIKISIIRDCTCRYISKELPVVPVPLDAVQVVAVQIVGTVEVSTVSGLYIAWDPQVNLGQTVKL